MRGSDRCVPGAVRGAQVEHIENQPESVRSGQGSSVPQHKEGRQDHDRTRRNYPRSGSGRDVRLRPLLIQPGWGGVCTAPPRLASSGRRDRSKVWSVASDLRMPTGGIVTASYVLKVPRNLHWEGQLCGRLAVFNKQVMAASLSGALPVSQLSAVRWARTGRLS